MDVSINLIDLKYLTNPAALSQLKNVKTQPMVSQQDVDFYKKRIFQLTKSLLQGGKVATNVNKAFEHYTKACINHFKFSDKVDIIQQDYENMQTASKQHSDFCLNDTNDLMLRKKSIRAPKITDHINVRSNGGIKPTIVIPKKRIFNLKDPKLRTKGLKKKNLSIK